MYHDIINSFHSFGDNLKISDINSLYPAAMHNCEMPVDPVNYFEGEITKQKVIKIFGFFYVKVTTPVFMERPLLKVTVKTEHGMRTVAPLGEWDM